MLKAKVDGKWFEVAAFYSDEHKHVSFDKDMVWLLGNGETQSGFVDVSSVEKFQYEGE